MSGETIITVVGNLTADPELYEPKISSALARKYLGKDMVDEFSKVGDAKITVKVPKKK